MRLQKRIRKEEKGTVAIVVAVSLTAVVGLAALGTDVGRLFLARQRLSTVADAAVLSGAQYLPNHADSAMSAVRSYLQKNGVDPDTATIQLGEDHRVIAVELKQDVSMTFARVIGPDQVPVNGGATARTDNLSGFFGAAPLAVPRADWQVGDQVNLKLGSGTGSAGSGNYQALALGGRGANTFENNLMYGYQDWIRLDDWVETKPGNMAGPTVRAVNYRIAQDPHATYTSFSRNSPRLLLVPIVRDFNVNGRSEVLVVGFGTFFLEEANDSGKNKGQVVGRFVKFVAEGEGSQAAPDFGAYTIKLIN